MPRIELELSAREAERLVEVLDLTVDEDDWCDDTLRLLARVATAIRCQS